MLACECRRPPHPQALLMEFEMKVANIQTQLFEGFPSPPLVPSSPPLQPLPHISPPNSPPRNLLCPDLPHQTSSLPIRTSSLFPPALPHPTRHPVASSALQLRSASPPFPTMVGPVKCVRHSHPHRCVLGGGERCPPQTTNLCPPKR